MEFKQWQPGSVEPKRGLGETPPPPIRFLATSSTLSRYGLGLLLSVLALSLAVLLRPLLEPNFFLLFFLPIALSFWYGGRGPGLLALAFGVGANALLLQDWSTSLPLSTYGLVTRLGLFALFSLLLGELAGVERREEESIFDSYQFLQSTLDALSTNIAILDRSGRIVAVNEAWRRFAEENQFEGDAGLGLNYLAVCDEATGDCADEAPVVAQGLRDLVSGARASFFLEYPCHSPDKQRWFMMHATLFFANGTAWVVVAHEDITGRKLAENALAEHLSYEQEARAQISTVLERITDAFYALDRDWRFTYVNTQAERLLQRRRDELLGRRVWEEFPATVGTIFYDEYHRAMEEQVTVRFETFYEPLGIWVEVNTYPTPDGLSVYFQDIGKRKEAEAERALLMARERTARAEAEAVVRLRDEVLAVVSHDLKTPLVAVKGYAQALQHLLAREGRPDMTRVKDGLARVDSAALRMTRMIDELLDVAKLQAGQPLDLDRAPTDLVALLRELAEQYRPSADSHAIRVDAPIPEMVGRWDEARLERVFANLISNAIKYSPEGGEIGITVRPEEVNGQKRAVVAVSDRGIGIGAEDLPYIFGRFYRAGKTAHRFEGTGIGLASARQIVEQHGGTIEVESLEGSGSTFTVSLPLERVQELCSDQERM